MFATAFRRLSTGLVLLLLTLAGACNATGLPASPTLAPNSTAAPASSNPTATLPPTRVPATTRPTTAPTNSSTTVPVTSQADSAYTAFTQRLKTALEKDDTLALQSLVSPTFGIGIWRSQGRAFKSVAEALQGIQEIRQGATVTVDLNRVAVEPVMTPPPDVHTLVARWMGSDGHETYAHLSVKQENGQWKWTNLLIGLDYYHSPVISMLIAEPKAYVAQEVMLIGEIRDPASEKVGTRPVDMVQDPFTFVLKDASGSALWVEISKISLDTRRLSTDQLKPGTTVRVIGIVQENQGEPVAVSDSVQLVKPGEYAAVKGTIADCVASARACTFQESGSPQFVLLETTPQDYANGKPIRAVPLGKGVRVLVVGRPGPGNVIHAEAVYIYL